MEIDAIQPEIDAIRRVIKNAKKSLLLYPDCDFVNECMQSVIAYNTPKLKTLIALKHGKNASSFSYLIPESAFYDRHDF